MPVVELRPYDELPSEPLRNTILMTVALQAPAVPVFSDADESVPQGAIPGAVGLKVRFPHLKMESVGGFELVSKVSQEKRLHAILAQAMDYMAAWVKPDNLRERVFLKPETGKGAVSFVAVGVNPFFAVGLMFSGKLNKPKSFTLYVLDLTEPEWKKSDYTVPEYSGVCVEGDGYDTFLVCKDTLRRIDCYSNDSPVEIWKSEPLNFGDPGNLAMIMRAFNGRVFVAGTEHDIKIYQKKDGTQLQHIHTKYKIYGISASFNSLIITSFGLLEMDILDHEDELFKERMVVDFAKTFKTVGGKALAIKARPITQVINQDTRYMIATDKRIYMEEGFTSVAKIRILDNVHTVAAGLIADHIVFVQADGVVKLGHFGERGSFYSKKLFKEDASAIWWPHREYVSGTFKAIHILAPDGQLIRIEPKVFTLDTDTTETV